MTLQEAKDQTAKKYGYDKWHKIDMYQLCENFNVRHADAFQEAIHDEAAELYARSKWDQACEETFNANAILFGYTKPEFKP